MSEDGSYSFTGVDNAEYYLIYFCAPDATSDDDTFIYTSDPIEANDSNTYSGPSPTPSSTPSATTW